MGTAEDEEDCSKLVGTAEDEEDCSKLVGTAENEGDCSKLVGTAENEGDCFRWVGQKQRKGKYTPRRRPKTEKEEDVRVEGPETVKTDTFPGGRAKNTENERLVRVEEPKTETAGDCSSCKDQREKKKKPVTRGKIQKFLLKHTWN